MNPLGNISQDEAMRRCWVRVTLKGTFSRGPITKIEDVYGSSLIIIFHAVFGYVVWKHFFGADYPTFHNEQDAAKYVADYISNHCTP